MTSHPRWLGVLLIICGLQASAADAVAARSAAQDQYVVGGNLRISQAVAGDLIAAAGTLDVDSPVAGDAVLLGGNLRLGNGVARSLFAAGGRLSVHGPIGHNLRVAGGQVELMPEASVAGNVSVAGGQVNLRSPIQGDLRVAGGKVWIDSSVEGDVWVSAGQLSLGPNARLNGALHWRSNEEFTRDPAAQIKGAVEQLRSRHAERNLRDDTRAHMPMQRAEQGWRDRSFITGGWWWTLGLMLLTATWVAAAPRVNQRVSSSLRERGAISLLAGFVIVVCLPVAALLLLITLIGAPVALVLMLLYGPLLIVGYVSFGAAVGQWALARWRPDRQAVTRWRVVTAMLAMLVLALLASLPWLGTLLALLAVFSGVGAIAIALQSLRKSPAATAAA
jgi:cytoskeletal protein CcmA (bactofilin family)